MYQEKIVLLVPSTGTFKSLAETIRVPDNRVPRSEENSDRPSAHAIAFAQIGAYTENSREDQQTAPVFSMAYLSHLYSFCLDQLGFKDEKVHSIHLQQKTEAATQGLICTNQGRDVILLFYKDNGNASKQACARDTEALELVTAAQIIRKVIFRKEECSVERLMTTVKKNQSKLL